MSKFCITVCLLFLPMVLPVLGQFDPTGAVARLPLFPELVRFPSSLGEEKLLHRREGSAITSPTVAILLPGQSRDIHLRACALFGARLGQLFYLSPNDCNLGLIGDWEQESGKRNGIVAGLVQELADLPLLRSITNDLAILKSGQGMLADLIVGQFPNQHRWVIATGTDDSGLEKAILTLGSTPALEALAPSPALIEAQPPPPTISRAPAANNPTETSAKKITDLSQLADLLVADPFLRKAAFLLPAQPSSAELKTLFDLAMQLGKRLSSSAGLWPEACTYAAGMVPPAARLEGRSILLLGSVAQWRFALPASARLPIELASKHTNFVLMQGRENSISLFEPGLVLMQLIPSPWSRDQTLVIVGGWHSFAGPALVQMVNEFAPQGKLYGNLAATDEKGRIASYDSRRASAEPFAEHLRREIPLGLSVAETNRRHAQGKVRARRVSYVNNLVLSWAGGLLLACILCRLLLLWDQERRRKKSVRQESASK